MHVSTTLHRGRHFTGLRHSRTATVPGTARCMGNALARRRRCSQQPCSASASDLPLTATPDDVAVVIVDHGSRRAASNDMLLEFCELYKQATGQRLLEPAHMEIAEPTIAQAIGRCAEAGAKAVVVVPYFLSRGRHIQDDIPALVREAQQQHPHLNCTVAEPIGVDPLMVALINQRVGSALQR